MEHLSNDHEDQPNQYVGLLSRFLGATVFVI